LLPKNLIDRGSVVLFLLKTALFFHFLFLFLYLMPQNPIKYKYRYYLFDYFNYPFTRQEWTLFAPNPASSNISIYFKVECYGENFTKTSKWINATLPLIKDKRKSIYTTQSQRLLKLQSSLYSELLGTEQQMRKLDSNRFYIKNDNPLNSIMLNYGQIFFKKDIALLKPDSISIKYIFLSEEFQRFNNRYDKSRKNISYKFLVSENNIVRL
jgi:hypothetical protein